MRRPNVLYFVCHDLGRALGCYGAGIPTPHLDAFAPAEPLRDLAPLDDQDWTSWENSWPLSPDPRPAEELYDLCADPLELHNLALDPAHAATLATFRQQLVAAMRDTGDHLPSPRPEPPSWGPHWPPLESRL